MRPGYEDVMAELSLLELLSDFTPVVIGTPPLGIAIESSDIDVACYARKLEQFERVATQAFSHFSDYRQRRAKWQGHESTSISFRSLGWQIELFCQMVSTDEQWGVRHYQVERRLVELEPWLRTVVLRLKMAGLKTEPAFAQALRLPGDPYEAILELESCTDDELGRLIRDALTE